MPSASRTTIAPAPGAERRAMSQGTVVLVLSALLGIQPITTDLYLPALPALVEDLGAGMPQAQLTLTALLLAFGVSQLVWGPRSDRFGRRPILLLGLVGYVAASIGGALAASMDLLIVWRALQGAAMGAGVMGARAIIRDMYAPGEGARMMSKAFTGLGLMACLSAPLGGLAAAWISWRAALLIPALFGVVSLGLIAWRFDETLARKNPQALQPVTLLRNWVTIGSNPAFLAFSILSAASYAGLFTFLAASSFVFIRVLHVGTTQYGLLMFSMSLSYILGTFLCRRLLPRAGVRRSIALAAALTLASGTLMGVFAWSGLSSGPHGGWFIMLPIYGFMLAHGVHQPCGQSGSVTPFPHTAGAASALNGFISMAAAFAMGGWLGRHMDGSVFPLTNGVWFWSVAIALTAWTLVQKHGEPARAPDGPA